MPVTAKLSKVFYDRLGEQVAQEPVEWLNTVDATSRADLRELNELNFARFDAKLEQRCAELRARIDQVAAELHARIDKGDLERRLGQRTLWLVAGWVVLMAAVIGLWFKG